MFGRFSAIIGYRIAKYGTYVDLNQINSYSDIDIDKKVDASSLNIRLGVRF